MLSIYVLLRGPIHPICPIMSNLVFRYTIVKSPELLVWSLRIVLELAIVLCLGSFVLQGRGGSG